MSHDNIQTLGDLAVVAAVLLVVALAMWVMNR